VLPAIEPSAHAYGENRSEFLGGRPVPVSAIAGDQQAALFGQACFAAGDTKNTYGTGSFVLQHAGSKPPSDRGALVATVACTPEGSATEYALEGSIFSTGSAVQWLRDGLGIIADVAESELLAASLTSNDDVYFVPALAGLGAPVWDPTARGTLIGATRGTTRAHLARAVLESVAFQSRDVLDELARLGTPVDELRVDGGAASNGWLMQFQADITGIPVDVTTERETTGLGAAYAAGLTCGLWRDREELAGLRRRAARYEPALSAAGRDALYERWLEARERSRRWARPGVGED
jgi:glycerol kinase